MVPTARFESIRSRLQMYADTMRPQDLVEWLKRQLGTHTHTLYGVLHSSKAKFSQIKIPVSEEGHTEGFMQRYEIEQVELEVVEGQWQGAWLFRHNSQAGYLRMTQDLDIEHTQGMRGIFVAPDGQPLRMLVRPVGFVPTNQSYLGKARGGAGAQTQQQGGELSAVMQLLQAMQTQQNLITQALVEANIMRPPATALSPALTQASDGSTEWSQPKYAQNLTEDAAPEHFLYGEPGMGTLTQMPGAGSVAAQIYEQLYQEIRDKAQTAPGQLWQPAMTYGGKTVPWWSAQLGPTGDGLIDVRGWMSPLARDNLHLVHLALHQLGAEGRIELEIRDRGVVWGAKRGGGGGTGAAAP
jgi:hypothetical protein